MALGISKERQTHSSEWSNEQIRPLGAGRHSHEGRYRSVVFRFDGMNGELRPGAGHGTLYRIQAGRYVQISPDFQFIQNPGYNRDRGPVEVHGVRLHLSY